MPVFVESSLDTLDLDACSSEADEEAYVESDLP